jgi:hypothetical protein
MPQPWRGLAETLDQLNREDDALDARARASELES